MSNAGRPSEKKTWDNVFRQTFRTIYFKDPDLHILFFLNSENINEIMRVALRDYMIKYDSKALDTAYQAEVFMAASALMSRGAQPYVGEVLAEMDRKSAGTLSAPLHDQEPRRAVEPATPPTPSAPVVFSVAPPKASPAAPHAAHSDRSVAIPVAPVLPQTQTAAVQEFAPMDEAITRIIEPTHAPAPMPAIPAAVPVRASDKPKAAFDFGSSPSVPDIDPGVQPAPVSQRDKWLNRAKF